MSVKCELEANTHRAWRGKAQKCGHWQTNKLTITNKFCSLVEDRFGHATNEE